MNRPRNIVRVYFCICLIQLWKTIRHGVIQLSFILHDYLLCLSMTISIFYWNIHFILQNLPFSALELFFDYPHKIVKMFWNWLFTLLSVFHPKKDIHMLFLSLNLAILVMFITVFFQLVSIFQDLLRTQNLSALHLILGSSNISLLGNTLLYPFFMWQIFELFPSFGCYE